MGSLARAIIEQEARKTARRLIEAQAESYRENRVERLKELGIDPVAPRREVIAQLEAREASTRGRRSTGMGSVPVYRDREKLMLALLVEKMDVERYVS